MSFDNTRDTLVVLKISYAGQSVPSHGVRAFFAIAEHSHVQACEAACAEPWHGASLLENGMAIEFDDDVADA